MRNLFLLFSLAVLTVSCNSNKSSQPQGQVVSKIELYKLCQDKANKDKRVAVEGYPALTGDIRSGNGNKVVLSIYTEPDGQGSAIYAVPMEVGKGSNKFHVPDEFTIQDIVVYDNDGKEHQYNEKLRFSFSMDLQTNLQRTKYHHRERVNGNLEQSEFLVYQLRPKDLRIDKAE
jgi:hypothetical protein